MPLNVASSMASPSQARARLEHSLDLKIGGQPAAHYADVCNRCSVVLILRRTSRLAEQVYNDRMRDMLGHTLIAEIIQVEIVP